METPHELVGAFTEAVPFALRELAGIEAVVREERPASAADNAADLSAVVRLTAAGGESRLILCFPARTAEALAGRVLAGAAEVTAELVRDCMGEVANVVAGQAKALLVGSPSHFTLSTPVVRDGGPADAAGGWVIRFESDVGGFGVRLC